MLRYQTSPTQELIDNPAIESLVWEKERIFWEEQGAGEWFLDKIEQTPFFEMWYPSFDVLVERNFVTHVQTENKLWPADAYCKRHDCSGSRQP